MSWDRLTREMLVHAVALAHNTLVCAIFTVFPTGNVSSPNEHESRHPPYSLRDEEADARKRNK